MQASSPLTLSAVRLVDRPDELVDVTLAEGRVAAIVSSQSPGSGGGHWVAPGLVDLQVNGGWGHDLTEDPEAVWSVGDGLARLGVTSWLPTLVSGDGDTRKAALEVLAAGPPPGWYGATPLGWHFEGPYLNPARRGAHRLEALQPIPDSLAAGRLDDEPLPRLITLAPELPGADAAIRALAGAGVIVSIGHTEASADRVRAAIGAGATFGTHLFNAMSGLSHRSPGAAAGLLNGGAWLGLIGDGHHVDPEMMRLVWRAAGNRLVLVSDMMAGLGLPDGPTLLAGLEVVIGNGAVRRPDGALAGSVVPLNEALNRFRRATGCDLAALFQVAAANPCRAIGEPERGAVRVGAIADLLVIDGDGGLRGVHVAGRPVEPEPGIDLAVAGTSPVRFDRD